MKDLFEEMKRLQREMNKLFENLWATSDFGAKMFGDIKKLEDFRQPLSDIRETDKNIIATIELPGIEKKDIQLSVTENYIEIKAEKKEEAKIAKENYFRAERSYRGFYRTIPLPVKVIPEHAEAVFKNGILEITIPKAITEKRKEKKKIEIK